MAEMRMKYREAHTGGVSEGFHAQRLRIIGPNDCDCPRNPPGMAVSTAEGAQRAAVSS